MTPNRIPVRAARWLQWPVALGALIITCLPSAIWAHPAVDIVQTGFDPNLVYASSGGQVSRNLMTLAAPSDPLVPTHKTSISLLSTPLEKFAVSFLATVDSNTGTGTPLQIGIWSVWTGAGYFVTFDSSTKSIQTQAVVGGGAGSTLVGGDVTRTRQLGAYVVGQPYQVKMAYDRTNGLTVRVQGSALQAEDVATPRDIPELFRSSRVALTTSAEAITGSTRASLADYSLALPHQSSWVNKADDVRERILLIGLLILSGFAVAIAAVAWLLERRRNWSPRAVAERTALTMQSLARRRFSVIGVVLACAAYVIGNALLFRLGGHPFDMSLEKLYAYVAWSYGPDQLYYVPNVVSLAGIWNGIPYIESAFPYEPMIAYLFTGVGWLQSLLTAGGAAFNPSTVSLEYIIKTINVAFGLGDAALIYLILKVLRISERWRLVAVGLFIFNPAVWFSMSVWGQTHVISIFFVLAAVLFIEKNIPVLAWLALLAACLTRPQMLVFGLLLAIVLLRRFSWKQNAAALSWTAILALVALAPITLRTSPSAPIDIMLNVFRIQEAGGNEVVLTTVSQDAYSVWPLVTYAAHGASGLGRAFTPSSAILVGSLTYQRLSQVLTLAAILIVGGLLLFRKRVTTEPGAYLPFVALGITSFLMLLTGLVATHFLLALPFLLLCRRWLGGVAYIYVIVVWTVTTLVPMFGDMGFVISSRQYPLLAPANNAVTAFFVHLYAWDRFITVAIVANICAVIWIAAMSLRRDLPKRAAVAG